MNTFLLTAIFCLRKKITPFQTSQTQLSHKLREIVMCVCFNLKTLPTPLIPFSKASFHGSLFSSRRPHLSLSPITDHPIRWISQDGLITSTTCVNFKEIFFTKSLSTFPKLLSTNSLQFESAKKCWKFLSQTPVGFITSITSISESGVCTRV